MNESLQAGKLLCAQAKPAILMAYKAVRTLRVRL